MSVVNIDGSRGEGGGQILRSAVALAAVTGKPVNITSIRGGRKKPGLLRQHLTAVRAVQEICGATVEGAELGSRALRLEPGKPRGGRYEFSIGSAGSACLVLQTVLPPLLAADSDSEIVLHGGTHNPFAPPFDFLVQTFLPALRRCGVRVQAELIRPGFYPAGGGTLSVQVEPCAQLRPFELLARGALVDISAKVMLVALPRGIAEAQLAVLRQNLDLAEDRCTIDERSEGPGPGNVAMVRVEYENHVETFSAFGEKGVFRERVAKDLTTEVGRYLKATGPVSVYLADQLILPLALAGGGTFRTVGISGHCSTNIEVIQKFLDVSVHTERLSRGNVAVRLGVAP